MKIYKRAFLFILMVFILALFQCSAIGENLLENADFAELDQDGFPAGWYTDAYILDPGYSVFSTGEGDSEHPNIVTIQNIGENDARFAQAVEVEPDSLYLLSGYILASDVKGGHGANFSVEGVYAFSEKEYDTGGEWKYIEYYGETGPDQDYIVVFARLGGYSGMSTGKASFSGISLSKVDSIPGDITADMWYKESSVSYDDEDEEDIEKNTAVPFRIWLIIISIVYLSASLFAVYHEHTGSDQIADQRHIPPVFVAAAIFMAHLLRMFISCLVEGYMVDVNCFLSWGHTMASVGPVSFYESTNFCDYPPLYTYVLGFNSIIAGLIGGGAATARVVFRFIPSFCDVLGCWLIYRLITGQKLFRERSSFFFLVSALFNPATILNSAAWGQMDSVLCLLILSVSLSAIKGNWKTALPLYVVSVLIKPQALMLGPLGLICTVLTFHYYQKTRKEILYGIGISILVLAVCLVPFSLKQDWDWIIQLYSRTLSSYPYATINTANFYYLLGGNWSSVEKEANVLAPVFLALFSTGYGIWWHYRAKNLPHHMIETCISICFTVAFILCAFYQSSWVWTGTIAMVFPFMIVLSPAVRTKDIRILPWLGGLLYILLYVFGIKMHERYIFPALLLLASSWAILKDRRILYIILLFTTTVFINEGIVLDNSIRLGSSLGHLNSDTVWIADIVSLINVTGAVYALWLSPDLCFSLRDNPVKNKVSAEHIKNESDRSLHWCRKDSVLLVAITAIYSVISLLTLGSTKAPQTCWTSSSPDEEIIFDLGEKTDSFEILYFAQVSRNDFSFTVSEDGVRWQEETWAQMDQGQCWKWKYVTLSYETESDGRKYYNSDESYIMRFNGRYVKLKSYQLGLKLNEILFRNSDGDILPVQITHWTGAETDSELYSDPSALLDEQNTLEGLPSFPESEQTAHAKIQPSWWNSTYFDEIYHARTAYEFLHGSIPYETSHPPLGKVLMSAAVAVFGMTPFGWRFAGALAGILMLPGMYLLGKQLTKKTYIAVSASLLMALDCQHLTQTQIATIDSFPVLFIIFAYFFMLRFVQTDYYHEKYSVSLIPLCLSGLFMGLSIASKWIGIYAGAGLAILYFMHCYRTVHLQYYLHGDIRSVWHKTIRICLCCILFFIIIPILLYLLSYIPYMSYNTKRIHSLWDYISEVIRAQVNMFNYHSTPNLGMDHPFYSPWWEWPIIGKPMYYASQQYIPQDYPVHHSIFCFGNPVIWYGGIAAIIFCLLRSLLNRRYHQEGTDYLWHIRSCSSGSCTAFMMIGFLAQYLPWVLVPRGTYIYHYFASIPFLILAIVLCFEGYSKRISRYVKTVSVFYILAAAVFFILLFPYASGLNVSPAWLNIGRQLLRIWY